MATTRSDWWDRIQDAAVRSVLFLVLRLPYEQRVGTMGWLVSRILAPLAGWRQRIRRNLSYVFPEMSRAEIEKLTRLVPEYAGRTFVENYSTPDLIRRVSETPFEGDGFYALQTARSESRPVILATGHFGNYEAPRAALVSRGINVGGLYRPMANPYFNTHYARTMESLGGPVVPQGRKGTSQFIQALKSGQSMVLLFDVHAFEAPKLDFLGKPARTATSAADMALKYGADLIPFYGIREPNKLDFRLVFEAPIPHSDAQTMTQALNDSLAARIRTAPEQWFWVHRRWRPMR